jgi:hypothetical protein
VCQYLTPRRVRTPHPIVLLAALVLPACGTPRPSSTLVLDAPHAAAIAESVRAFADGVARDVSQHGPSAWRAYFADTAAFFMAAEGRLVFPSRDSATRGIDGLERAIAHIQLRWGDSLRVDALVPGLAMMAVPYEESRVDRAGHRVDERGFFTGLVEHRGRGWQFRDAHWSVLAPPGPVP